MHWRSTMKLGMDHWHHALKVPKVRGQQHVVIKMCTNVQKLMYIETMKKKVVGTEPNKKNLTDDCNYCMF